jgi:hypothetical protein
VGGSQLQEPQPHPLANFPTIAWNNLNLCSCCLQIDDKMKKLPMSLCRPGKDGAPISIQGLVLNPMWVQDLNRNNIPYLKNMPDSILPNPPVLQSLSS